jgi:hypothetical protein
MAPPLPPWIRSIKRPLDKLTHIRRSFEDLPDTEPGDVVAAPPRLRAPAPPAKDIAHTVSDDPALDAAEDTEATKRGR